MTAASEAAAKKWPASKPQLWALDKIRPYEKNARTHPPEQISLLAAILKRRGVDQPIVVDEAGVILKGHGRRLAAIEAGLTQFPVAIWRGLSEDEKKAIRIEDNQVALLSGWDHELLRVELSELKRDGADLMDLGFDAGEVEKILAWGEPLDGMPVLADGDRTPFQQVTFTLHDSQIARLKEAIAYAKSLGPFDGSPNENSNGNALARICEAYLNDRD